MGSFNCSVCVHRVVKAMKLLISSTSVSLAILLVVGVALTRSVEGYEMECFECTSSENMDCADPFWGEEDIPHHRKDSLKEKCPSDDGMDWVNVCRKTKIADDAARVTRECATVPKNWHSNAPCKNTKVNGEDAFVCDCEEDGCNDSTNLPLSQMLVVLTSSLVLFRVHVQ